MRKSVEAYRRSERCFMRVRMEEVCGLLPLEGMVLYLLDEPGEHRQEDLGCQIEIDKGRTAKTMAALEERGVNERKVNAHNRREKLVSLTAAGREYAARIAGIFREWEDICYAGFTPEERAQYEDMLLRIARNVLSCRRKEEEENG